MRKFSGFMITSILLSSSLYGGIAPIPPSLSNSPTPNTSNTSDGNTSNLPFIAAGVGVPTILGATVLGGGGGVAAAAGGGFYAYKKLKGRNQGDTISLTRPKNKKTVLREIYKKTGKKIADAALVSISGAVFDRLTDTLPKKFMNLLGVLTKEEAREIANFGEFLEKKKNSPTLLKDIETYLDDFEKRFNKRMAPSSLLEKQNYFASLYKISASFRDTLKMMEKREDISPKERKIFERVGDYYGRLLNNQINAIKNEESVSLSSIFYRNDSSEAQRIQQRSQGSLEDDLNKLKEITEKMEKENDPKNKGTIKKNRALIEKITRDEHLKPFLESDKADENVLQGYVKEDIDDLKEKIKFSEQKIDKFQRKLKNYPHYKNMSLGELAKLEQDLPPKEIPKPKDGPLKNWVINKNKYPREGVGGEIEKAHSLKKKIDVHQRRIQDYNNQIDLPKHYQQTRQDLTKALNRNRL